MSRRGLASGSGSGSAAQSHGVGVKGAIDSYKGADWAYVGVVGGGVQVGQEEPYPFLPQTRSSLLIAVCCWRCMVEPGGPLVTSDPSETASGPKLSLRHGGSCRTMAQGSDGVRPTCSAGSERRPAHTQHSCPGLCSAEQQFAGVAPTRTVISRTGRWASQTRRDSLVEPGYR